MTSYSPSLPIHNRISSSNHHQQRPTPFFLSPFVLALLLSFSFLYFLSLQIPHHRLITPTPTSASNFSLIFSDLHQLLSNSSHALIISSHPTHHIVLALQQSGFSGPISETSQHINPLPFGDQSFELVFTDVFDKVADGAKSAQEVERVLKESGICILLLGSRMENVTALFELSEVMEVKHIDGFGSHHTKTIVRRTQNHPQTDTFPFSHQEQNG